MKSLVSEIKTADRSVLIEMKGKDIVVKSKDRNSTKQKVEKHLKKKKVHFESVFKKAKSSSLDVLQVVGGGDIIFKPVIQKGAGGLKFEKELALDIKNYLNGADYSTLKNSDVIKEMENVLKFNRKQKYTILEEGSKNKKRKVTFDGNKLVIENSDGPTLTDLTLMDQKSHPMYLSLKMSATYYTMNAAVGDYFADGRTKIKINQYFGFNGQKMAGFGKKFACVTKKPDYAKVSNNLSEILNAAVGINVILIHKKTENDVLVSVNKNTNRVSISSLNETSYTYPEKGVRKYANIKTNANINGHRYEVNFQFRGTTTTDIGPKYLRVLLERL